MKAASLLFSLLFILSSNASAEEPSPPTDLVARISPRGLSFLAGEARSLIPRGFTHASFSRRLVDCPFTNHDTVLALSGARSFLDIKALVVTPGHERLMIGIKADVAGFTYLKITRPYACVGYPLSCRVDFQSRRVVATVSFVPRVVGGRVRLTDPRVQLSVAPSSVEAGVTSCGLIGDLVNLALPLVKGYLVDAVTARIERAAVDQLRPQVEELLAGFSRPSGALSGFQVGAQLEQLSVSPEGLGLGLDLSIAATEQGSCAADASSDQLPPASTPVPSSGAEHFALALSARALSEALRAAWRGGLLCLSSDQLRAAGATHALPSVASFLLGLSGSPPLSLRSPRAPRLELLPAAGASLRVTLPAAELAIDGQGPAGPTTVTATADATLDLRLKIDPASRAIVVDGGSASLKGLRLSATDPTGLRLEQPLLLKLIGGLFGSLVSQQLDGLELLPQVLEQRGGPLDAYLLQLTRSSTTPEQLQLHVDLFRRPSYDDGAPDTGLERRPPRRTSQQVLDLRAIGSDGKTPAQLLRYSWRLDAGAWSEPVYSATRSLSLSEGAHRIEVRAVDLNGNIDPTPAAVDVVVDPTAPAGEWGKGDEIGRLEREDAAGGCSLGSRPARWPLGLALLALALRLRRRR